MTVHIQIDKDWAIRSDPYCWMLCKYAKRMRKNLPLVEWQPVKFYNSLEALMKAELERRVRVSNASTYAQVLENRDKALAVLSQALTIPSEKLEELKKQARELEKAL